MSSLGEYINDSKNIQRTDEGVPERYYEGLEKGVSRFDIYGSIEEVPSFEDKEEAKHYIYDQFDLPDFMYTDFEKSFKISWGLDGAPEKDQEIYKEALGEVYDELVEYEDNLKKTKDNALKAVLGVACTGFIGSTILGVNPIYSGISAITGGVMAGGIINKKYDKVIFENLEKRDRVRVLEHIFVDEPLTRSEIEEIRGE